MIQEGGPTQITGGQSPGEKDSQAQKEMDVRGNSEVIRGNKI